MWFLGPKMAKNRKNFNNFDPFHINALLLNLSELLRTLILSSYSILYVHFWGHSGYVNDIFKKYVKIWILPTKWDFFIYLFLTFIYLPKWLIKLKKLINCGILEHFWPFWGDFLCFSKDFWRFSQNRIFKRKMAAARAPKMVKNIFTLYIILKPLKVDMYQKSSISIDKWPK